MVSLVVFGVGNVLSMDDGAGPAAACELSSRGFHAFDCGTAPENFCKTLRSLKPETLLIIDAADMGLAAGELRLIPVNRIADVSIGTHMLSLGFFISYVQELCSRIVIAGIQPRELEFGEGLSEPVRQAVDAVCRAVSEGQIEAIPVFT